MNGDGNGKLNFDSIGRIFFIKSICHYICIEGMLNEHVHDCIHLHSMLPMSLCLQGHKTSSAPNY